MSVALALTTSAGETVRTGVPNLRHYSDGRRVHRYTALSQSLRSKGYPELTVSARHLSAFVGHLQLFMERNLGRYAKDVESIGITRIPASVFRDLSREGTLEKVVEWTLNFGKEKELWDMLPDFKEEGKRDSYLDFVRFLDEKLKEERIVEVPMVYFAEGIEENDIVELRDCTLAHGGLVVNIPEVASHIVYPDLKGPKRTEDVSKSDDDETKNEAPLCRILAIEPRAGTNVARIHWWYCPRSYDSKVSVNDVYGDVDPYGPPPPVWHLQARFLRDTHLYNEWMVEEDYELPDDYPTKIEVSNDFGIQGFSLFGDSSGRGGRVQRLILKVGRPGKRKRINHNEHEWDRNGNIIVPLPEIPFPLTSDTEEEPVEGKPLRSRGDAASVQRSTFAESDGERSSGKEETGDRNSDLHQGARASGGILSRKRTADCDSNEHSESSDKIPGYSSWFSLKKIHQIEMRSLPEFFCGRYRSKTPRIYQDARNFMVEAFRRAPTRYLSGTAVRRFLHGDAPALLRIHAFLDHWGLINCGVSPKMRPNSPFLPPPMPTPSGDCTLFLDNGSSAEIESYSYRVSVHQGPVFRRKRSEKFMIQGYSAESYDAFEDDVANSRPWQSPELIQESYDRYFSKAFNGSQGDSAGVSSTRAKRRTRVRHNYNEDLNDSDEEHSIKGSEVTGSIGPGGATDDDELLAKVNFARWTARLKQRIATACSGLNETRTRNTTQRLQRAKAIQYHCNSCDRDCSSTRYHASTRPDVDLCGRCYSERKFPDDMAPSDFIQMSSPPASFFNSDTRKKGIEASSPVQKNHRRRRSGPGGRLHGAGGFDSDSDGDSAFNGECDGAGQDGIADGVWTESETLLLLEALEMYSDYWEKVSEHVGSKTATECVEQFLKLPIEDPYLSHGGKKWWGGDDLGAFHSILEPMGSESSGFQLSSDQMNILEELLGGQLGNAREWTGHPAVMADRDDGIGVDVSVLAALVGNGTKLHLVPDYGLSKDPTHSFAVDGSKYKKMVKAVPSIKRMVCEDWGIETASLFLGGGKTVTDKNEELTSRPSTPTRNLEVSKDLESSDEDLAENAYIAQSGSREQAEIAKDWNEKSAKRKGAYSDGPPQKRLRKKEDEANAAPSSPDTEQEDNFDDTDFSSLQLTDVERGLDRIPSIPEGRESVCIRRVGGPTMLKKERGAAITTSNAEDTPGHDPLSIPTLNRSKEVDMKSNGAVASLIFAAAKCRAKELAALEQKEIERLRSVIEETVLRMVHMKASRLNLLFDHERRAAKARDVDSHMKFADKMVAKNMSLASPHEMRDRGTVIAKSKR